MQLIPQVSTLKEVSTVMVLLCLQYQVQGGLLFPPSLALPIACIPFSPMIYLDHQE